MSRTLSTASIGLRAVSSSSGSFPLPTIRTQYPIRRATSYKKPTFEDSLVAYLSRTSPQFKSPAPNMFLLPGLRRTLLLSTPLILSAPMLAHQFRTRRPVYCDSADPLTKITSDLKRSYASEAQTPIITDSGAPNPRAVRQVSMGSILGVLCGMGVSVFSKPLAILLGLGIFLVQFIESRGIHIIPYSYLQRRFKSANVRSVVRDNVAFKMSFGLTFALAAFAEF